MNWTEALRLIRDRIQAGETRILKCDGVARRLVTAHRDSKISMRTGVQTAQQKAITYEMLEFALGRIQSTGRFTSDDFRDRFGREYKAAPCRYSMTGGVLVEIGVARLVPGDGDSCIYLRAS